MQDVPLISNIGSEFQLKPVNYFAALASLDIGEALILLSLNADTSCNRICSLHLASKVHLTLQQDTVLRNF